MRRKPREDGATALYELRGADKALLYVGISHRPAARWREHAKQKLWWPDVVRRSLIWFGTRAEAILAEQVAIESAGPRHNQTTSPQDVPPPPGGTMPLSELRRLTLAYKAAHRALAEGVVAELARGGDEDRIARSVDWSREYVARIRKERNADEAAPGTD
ncbi:hypothetical protein ACFPH6_19450 [Streptomyces xiangluensis]|uniref:GIY-YIG domain-containing protein n=1 Tax=Streptomyces xiangluensis TaxID=2665720 RepID=A0ABV8YQY1_9ACTN